MPSLTTLLQLLVVAATLALVLDSLRRDMTRRRDARTISRRIRGIGRLPAQSAGARAGGYPTPLVPETMVCSKCGMAGLCTLGCPLSTCSIPQQMYEWRTQSGSTPAVGDRGPVNRDFETWLSGYEPTTSTDEVGR
jgi:hypothetical protein